MHDKFPQEARRIMEERFGHDCLIALATVDGTVPFARTVNSYYEDGCFYVITYALSNKMKQIAKKYRKRFMDKEFKSLEILKTLQ